MSSSTNRVDEIRARLTAAFSPTSLEIVDESHKHKGHEGARDGRGHFRVMIVSSLFANKTRIERHRMVFESLGDLLLTDIHAVSISAHDKEN